MDLSRRTGVKRWTCEGWARLIAAAPRLELEQAGLRLVIGTLVLLSLLWARLGHQGASADSLQMIWVLAGFAAFAAAITLWVLFAPRISPTRRVLGMIADNAAITYFMLQMGESGALVVGIFMFVAFGNAFRYGRSYLRISHGLALVGLSTVLVVSDFWSRHVMIGAGLLIMLLVLPMYVGLLVQRLNDERLRAEQALEQCIEEGRRGS